MSLWKKITINVGLLLTVVVSGTVGYVLIEKWSFSDSLYMTIITLTTIGFGEVQPLSSLGRNFTILLIIGGFSTITYTLGNLSAYFLGPTMYNLVNKRRMKERISQLKNHYIVCGAGIIGLVVIEELTLARKKIVLIDSDEDKLKKASKKFKCFTLIGDATKEETLKRANINRASGLIACFSDDHESVYMTMTARQLNKNLKIITKVKHEESLKKLQIAGADDVINPDHIGGMRIASHILRPRVVKFIDMLARDPKNVRIEEVEINEKSPFINKKLTIETIESKLKSRIIALKKNQGSKYLYKLSGKMLTLKKGDILYILKARS